jgi:hypothetical protein
MDFNELKEVIKYLKKELPCNTCNKKFTNKDISVLSCYNHDAVLHFNCTQCGNQLIVHAGLEEETTTTTKLNVHAKSATNITKNDVIDIHNFLNQFNGDFKTLFPTEPN